MFEYKVFTVRDTRLSGQFDAPALEHMLNDYAADGWRLRESVPASNLWKSAKSEIFLILEREQLLASPVNFETTVSS